MIRIVNIGMNHETAPVELRECLAKDPAHADRALAMMRELSFVKEGMFLSTCNRVEALFTTEQTDEAKGSVIAVLRSWEECLLKALLPIFSPMRTETPSAISSGWLRASTPW